MSAKTACDPRANNAAIATLKPLFIDLNLILVSLSVKITSRLRDVGFDPVDAGSLRIARYTEPFALLIGELAYGERNGPELAYRFQRFGE